MRYYILLLVLVLFACNDNVHLQTSVTVNVSKVGTLDSLLSKYRKDDIDTLVITGKINEIDLITIKYMDNLSYIDLEETELSSSVLKSHILVNRNRIQTIKLPNDQSLFYSLNPLDIKSKDNKPLDIDGVLLKSKDGLSLYSRGTMDSMYIVSKSSKDRKVNYKGLPLYLQSYHGVDLPRVFVHYNQKVNGYTVSVLCFPRNEYSDQDMALLHFRKGVNEFYIYNPSYKEYQLFKFQPLREGDTISINYTEKNPTEYLTDQTPFFFQDVNFDGEDELLITKWQCGSRGSSTYDVYKVKQDGYSLEIPKLEIEPFTILESEKTTFDSKNKRITIQYFETHSNVKYIYEQRKKEIINWTELDTVYNFELVKAEIEDFYADYYVYKIYAKENGRYRTVKNERVPVNQHN